MQEFLQSVLGDEAFMALSKAGERNEAINSVIGIRTILSWANLASRWDFEGNVPGHEESTLQFKKTEDGLLGSISVGDREVDFENAQPQNLASLLCVALGCAPDMKKSEGANPKALRQLGESIDLMVKARVVSLLKAERTCPKCGSALIQKGKGWVCPNCGKKPIKKAEMPGKAAGATPPEGPVSQDGPKAVAPSRMAVKKMPQVTMTKSMQEVKCSVCEYEQVRDGEFEGCACLRPLARFVKSERKGEDLLLTFGSEWGAKRIQLLLDIVGGSNGQ